MSGVPEVIQFWDNFLGFHGSLYKQREKPQTQDSVRFNEIKPCTIFFLHSLWC